MVLDGTVHINSPPRIKEVNVKYGISECNVWDVNDEGRVDSIPKIFCSACKTQLGGHLLPTLNIFMGQLGLIGWNYLIKRPIYFRVSPAVLKSLKTHRVPITLIIPSSPLIVVSGNCV